jgi:predicted nucleotidyltransferase component of viral defense system
MNATERVPIRLHEDPDWFREAVRFTAAQTGFAARLIEKDYFCSVLLEYLIAADRSLVFKGGTCLAKVHAGFYRLSEDLDFSIPTPVDSPRGERSRRAEALTRIVAALPRRLASFQVREPLQGANNSTQYVAVLSYQSLIARTDDTIRLELGLREPLFMTAETHATHSILLDPVANEEAVAPFPLPCIAKAEAFAEKIRAALTRREVAIRDFYDLDYAARRLDFRLDDDGVVDLVRRKLAVPGNDPLDTSDARLASLRKQLDTQLKSVLRERDFREFDLERAFGAVSSIALRVGSSAR